MAGPARRTDRRQQLFPGRRRVRQDLPIRGKGRGVQAGPARQAQRARHVVARGHQGDAPVPTSARVSLHVLDRVHRPALHHDAIVRHAERQQELAHRLGFGLRRRRLADLHRIGAAAHDDARRHAAMEQAGGMPHPVGTVEELGIGPQRRDGGADAAAQHDDGVVAAGRRRRGLGARLVLQRPHQGVGHQGEGKDDELARSPARRPAGRAAAAETATAPRPTISPAVKTPIGDASSSARIFRTMKLFMSPRRSGGLY